MENTMTLDELILNFAAQIKQTSDEIETLETEMNDVKINPYGITKIDFGKRNDLIEKRTKLIGAVEGLMIYKRDGLNEDVDTDADGNFILTIPEDEEE